MDILPFLLNGVQLGLLFALIALGFMLIVGVMEVINLAHGSLFALGGYLAMTLLGADAGHPPGLGAWLLVLVAAPLLVGVVGMGLELGMRRTYGKDPLYGLLFSFGAALVIEEAIRLIWGARDWSFTVPTALSGTVMLGALSYPWYRFVASFIAITLIGLLWLLLARTRFGSVIKAGAHDSEMVRALGIDLARLRLLVFALGTALAAVAGVVIAPIWGLRPHVGVDAVIPAFLIIVLGGIGSFWGAVLAGLLVGQAVSLTAFFAPAWSLLSMYLLLIAVVTLRSRGMFGAKSRLEA